MVSWLGYLLLTADARHAPQIVASVALRAAGLRERPALFARGEDGVVVLKGELDVEVGSLRHSLKAGDSIYFNAGCPSLA